MNFRDTGFFTAGLGFLALAKAKNVLQGYSSPKPFDISQTDRCIDYDLKVVSEWMRELTRYAGPAATVAGKNVLELGPGSDLGVGLILLARGARTYNACDVHDLAHHTPPAFYAALFSELARQDASVDVPALQQALSDAAARAPSRLNYVVRDDFDIEAAFGRNTVDMVFSQAAFEHFDDIDGVVRRLSAVCRPGATIVAEIDLKTHSRWIRDKDPNNIYRYPDSVYNIFRFRGIPNRVRPYQYRAAFERHGWTDVEMRPLAQLEAAHGDPSGLSRAFRGDTNQMSYLSIAFCARKRS